jgi:hypothetical protein
MSKNRDIVHEIRGKLSPVTHLIWCVQNKHDHKLDENADLANEYMDKVLVLLEKIE